jgi:hypothetical protein
MSDGSVDRGTSIRLASAGPLAGGLHHQPFRTELRRDVLAYGGALFSQYHLASLNAVVLRHLRRGAFTRLRNSE